MVVVMAPEATDEDVNAVVSRVTDAGGEAFISRGETRTIVGLVGDVDLFSSLELRALRGVSDVVRISVAVQARLAPEPPPDDDGLGGTRSAPRADRP